MPDLAHSWNWRPRAGYSATIDQIIQAKKHSGKVLGEKLLKQRAAELKIEPNAVVMRINDDGFKGPDIDKTHSRVRILTIGDPAHLVRCSMTTRIHGARARTQPLR